MTDLPVMLAPRVVNARVDALWLAYRVELEPDCIEELERRAKVAREHGRAAFNFKGVFGELRYSRTARCWQITSAEWRMRIDLKAPGGLHVEGGHSEPGWTVEVIWLAQALALRPNVDDVVWETASIVRQLAAVSWKTGSRMFHEQRLRRIDLCVDVAGRPIAEKDIENLVKRSRARVTQHPYEMIHRKPYLQDRFTDSDPQVHFRQARRISGISIGRGGDVMCRIYDKLFHLESMHPETKQQEGDRWYRNGWDGIDDVTRIEFQLRGGAIKEFGLRDPADAVDPETAKPLGKGCGICVECNKNREWRCERREYVTLGQRLGALWAACLNWVRLIERTHSRISRCKEDDLWRMLRWVNFDAPGKKHEPAKRRRVRGGASHEQTLGCVLSLLANRGLLPEMSEIEREDTEREREIAAFCTETRVAAYFAEASRVVSFELQQKWGVVKSFYHLSVAVNATRARIGWDGFEDEIWRNIEADFVDEGEPAAA